MPPFAGGSIDADCVTGVEEGLVQSYSLHLLNSESDLTAPDDIMQSAPRFVLSIYAIEVMDPLDRWSIPL